MSKHTKGPWAFTEGRADRQEMSQVFTEKDRDFQIAMVTCEALNKSQRAEDIANARLIAAAPELLNALTLALWRIENPAQAGAAQCKAAMHTDLSIIRAAIAKATGTPN